MGLAKMKRKDYILLALILLAALLGYGVLHWYPGVNNSGHRIAVITLDQQIVERIDLDRVEETREIILSGKYQETIRVEKGRIRFIQADCPDKICVNTGWLTAPGDTAVCLPNRAVVRIED